MLVRPILLLIAGFGMPVDAPWRVGIIIIAVTLFFE
jgi:hypothetical protein